MLELGFHNAGSLLRRRELISSSCLSVKWIAPSHVEETLLYAWLESSICPGWLLAVRSDTFFKCCKFEIANAMQMVSGEL